MQTLFVFISGTDEQTSEGSHSLPLCWKSIYLEAWKGFLILSNGDHMQANTHVTCTNIYAYRTNTRMLVNTHTAGLAA